MTVSDKDPAGRPDRPSPAARVFAEEAAGTFHAQGFPRMPARVLMALTTGPAAGVTADQLRERLGVSSAAISAALGYLQSVHFVRVRSVPGERKRLYTLAREDWYRAVLSRNGFYTEMARLCADALGDLADPADPADPQILERVTDMERFFTFLVDRFPPLLAEWERSQEKSQEKSQEERTP